MLDTTPVTTTITRLVSTGTTERDLLAVVAGHFPDLQDAIATAEKHAARKH
jgi:hypothetical protein